jgi:hypothetical protein
VPHHHFTYDTALKNLHCKRVTVPNVIHRGYLDFFPAWLDRLCPAVRRSVHSDKKKQVFVKRRPTRLPDTAADSSTSVSCTRFVPSSKERRVPRKQKCMLLTSFQDRIDLFLQRVKPIIAGTKLIADQQSTTSFTCYFQVRAILSLEAHYSYSSSADYLVPQSPLFILFECGRYCLSNRSFGPAAPWYCSSAGALVPRIAPSGRQCLGIIRVRTLLSLEPLLRASSALVLFECGRSCPSNCFIWAFSAFAIIRVRASVPRIILFGLAAPSYYSSAGSVPRIVFSGPAAPLCYSSAGFGPSNYSLRASSASTLFDCGLRSLDYSLRASSASTLFECGF